MKSVQHTLAEKSNTFYRNNFNKFIFVLFIAIFVLLLMVLGVLYQVRTRPLPVFYAVSAEGQRISLVPNKEPNLLSDTILRWASKAAVTAYTFDFANYNAQLDAARPYFTDVGWNGFRNSITGVINSVVQKQLFVNGVVSGPPVISNEGVLEGYGYAWRVQIPFLVTYQSANSTSRSSYTVIMTIVKIPTATNPQGIGVDQFVMM